MKLFCPIIVLLLLLASTQACASGTDPKSHASSEHSTARPFAPVSETLFQLDDTSMPLVARQEKGQMLLTLWELQAPEMVTELTLNGEPEQKRLQNALMQLLSVQSKADDLDTGTVTAASPSDYYLVWAIARAQMINSLDFSDASLRRFFTLNISHYECEPRAVVSELLIPDTYTNAIQTTAILDEVQQRLKKETFPRVAYMVNDQLGRHGTGYLGEVTRKTAGEKRFALYRKVAETGKHAGGSGAPVGGPFRVENGWLFLQVNSIIDDATDCFEANRPRIAQDFGREWLKKIETDTLTTAAQELKPEIRTFTTGTQPAAVAFRVADQAVTFEQARKLLPFLMGDQKDPRFWQSIQRQALEIELIYYSSIGKRIRKSSEYAALLKLQNYLAQQREIGKTAAADAATSRALLQEFYNSHKEQYSGESTATLVEYTCQPETTANLTPTEDEIFRCAAALENLRRELEHTQNDTAITLSSKIQTNRVTSVTLQRMSRPVQVALQGLESGDISPVFREGNTLKMLLIKDLAHSNESLDKVRDRVADDFRLEFRLNRWKKLIDPSHRRSQR